MADMVHRPKTKKTQVAKPPEIPPFDYGKLGDSERVVVQACAAEIHLQSRLLGGAVIEIGTNLLKARPLLKRGAWGSWLKHEFKLPEWKAQRWMKIAKTLGAISDDLSVFSPAVLSVLVEASAPLRGVIVDEVKAGAPAPTAKQVRQRIKGENKKSEDAPGSAAIEDSSAPEGVNPDADASQSDEADAKSQAPSMASDESTDDNWMRESQVKDADNAAATILAKLEAHQKGTSRALRPMIINIDPAILGSAIKRAFARQEEADQAEIGDPPTS